MPREKITKRQKDVSRLLRERKQICRDKLKIFKKRIKFSLLPILILSLSLFSCLPAEEVKIPEDKGKSISELGVVYKGMPKEYLENAGFTKYLLLSSKKEGNKEWLTFSDWTAPKSGDTITFIIENEKVKDWVRKGREKEKSDQDI